MVFHRILDLETGQDFYPALFLFKLHPISFLFFEVCWINLYQNCNLMNQDLLHLIGLTMVPQIGDIHAKALLTHFGSASAVFKARKSELSKIAGIGEIRAESVKSFSDFERVEAELTFIEKYNINVLSHTHPDYPKKLLHCVDAPVAIYYKGNADLNASHIISVIGTRNNTDYGRDMTQHILDTLDLEDVLVVSGLAYGIDSIAHKYALKKKIPTVGVLAHGLDTLYPAANKRMAKEMIENGGLLTEFMSGTNPDKQNFPKRNRLVAGMADAVVVVETDIRGGSMITAELANAYNKDVFAIPGKIPDPKSAGCNYLIMNNKAALIRDGKDITDMMNWSRPSTKLIQKKLFPELSPVEASIVEMLERQEKVHIDEINTLCTGTTSSSIAAGILKLELEGIIKSLPGKIYKLL